MKEGKTRLQKAKDKRRDQAWEDALKHPACRTMLLDIIGRCALYRDPFSGDEESTSYLVGKQAIARIILVQLDTIDPQLYPLMLLDQAKEEASVRRGKPAPEQESDDNG